MIAGGIIAEMEADESPDNYYFITDDSFPILLKGQTIKGSGVTINSWDEFAAFVLNYPKHFSEMGYLRSFSVVCGGVNPLKPVAFNSLLTSEAAPYLEAYAMANSSWVKTYIWSGEFRDQPNVAIEAFKTISAELSVQEKKRYIRMKQEANRQQ